MTDSNGVVPEKLFSLEVFSKKSRKVILSTTYFALCETNCKKSSFLFPKTAFHYGAAESFSFFFFFLPQNISLFLIDDKNRVELEQVDNDDASDYINASFVKVCSQSIFCCCYFLIHSCFILVKTIKHTEVSFHFG